MSVELQNEGTFRGLIMEYGTREGKRPSKSIGISLVVAVEDVWNLETGAWDDWRLYELEAKGDIWIVGKEGALLPNGVTSLMNCAGWDGDLTSVSQCTWMPRPCQIVVKKEVNAKYGDRFRIAYINAYDAIPGGQSNINLERVKALQSQYGSQFRALGSAAGLNAPPPVSRPMAPPSRPAPLQRNSDNTIQGVSTPAQVNAAIEDESIPF